MTSDEEVAEFYLGVYALGWHNRIPPKQLPAFVVSELERTSGQDFWECRYRSFGAEWPSPADAVRSVEPAVFKRMRREFSRLTRRRGFVEGIYARTGRQCVYCDRQNAEAIDHLVPLSKGGTNDIRNLRACCHRCNARKGRGSVERMLAMEPVYRAADRWDAMTEEERVEYVRARFATGRWTSRPLSTTEAA